MARQQMVARDKDICQIDVIAVAGAQAERVAPGRLPANTGRVVGHQHLGRVALKVEADQQMRQVPAARRPVLVAVDQPAAFDLPGVAAEDGPARGAAQLRLAGDAVEQGACLAGQAAELFKVFFGPGGALAHGAEEMQRHGGHHGR